jgi:hypothetical protein
VGAAGVVVGAGNREEGGGGGRSEERTTEAVPTNKCGVRERIKQEKNS